MHYKVEVLDKLVSYFPWRHNDNNSYLGLLWKSWLRLHLSVQGGVGLIPGQQLRFHMPCGVAKKKEKSNRITGTDHWCCTQSQAELWTSTHTTRLGVSLPPENSAQRFSGAIIYIRM